MTAVFSLAAIVAVWFCCLKLAAILVRPLLACRQLYVLDLVLLAFPMVFMSVGHLISYAGSTYCNSNSYQSTILMIGAATTWLWAIPIGTTICWKYYKTYKG